MFSFLKIDRDIFFVALYRVFQVGAVGLTSVLIPFFFDEVEQGIYFVFLNLVAAQLLFELGLNQAVLQVASHVIDRSSTSYRALISWLDLIYKRIALTFFLTLSLLGVVYLHLFTPSEYLYVTYYWVFIALFVAFGLSVAYRYPLIESESKVALSYLGRFLPLFFSTVGVWIFLLSGFKLISVVIGYAMQSAIAYYWLNKNHSFVRYGPQVSEGHDLHILQVKKIKNKFALSYIGGFIGFNSVVPVVYAIVSPADAGRVGLSLALFSAVTLVASSFIVAKNASMASLIAAGRFQELNGSYAKYFRLSIGASVFFSIGVFALIGVLNVIGDGFSNRLMATPVLVAVALAACANTAIYSMAIYVRSHKAEPFVAASLIAGCMTFVLALGGAKHSASWSVSGYVASVLLVSLPWTIAIFQRYYCANVDR